MKASSKSLLIGILLIWSLLATALAAYYYNEYSTVKKLYDSLTSKTIVVNIGIDYGNNTIRWFNGTILPSGTTVLSALTSIAKVEYVYGEYGAYVVSVNDVKEKKISEREGYSWLWYIYDISSGKFEMGPVAADKYTLSNGDIVLWRYSHWKF